MTVEAGLFDRAGRVARGNVNYTGDQIGGPYRSISGTLPCTRSQHLLHAPCHDISIAVSVRQLEDPNKLLDTIVSDIQADLMKMRQASAEVSDQTCEIPCSNADRIDCFLQMACTASCCEKP